MIKAEVRQSGKHICGCYKYCTNEKLTFIISLAISAVFAIASVVLIFLRTKVFVLCGILLLLICAAAAALLVRNRITNQRDRESIPPDKFIQKFFFDTDAFFIDYETDQDHFSVKVEYYEILSALETKEFFFISYEEFSYRTICKDELTQGTPAELSALLSQQLGEKYRKIAE